MRVRAQQQEQAHRVAPRQGDLHILPPILRSAETDFSKYHQVTIQIAWSQP